jgi:hypothetical protein
VNSTWLDGRETGGSYTGFVETGSSLFRTEDFCVQAAIDDAGLRRKVVNSLYPRTTAGVWDGGSFILHRAQDLKSRTAMDLIRDTWKYGLKVRRFQALVKEKLCRFRELYAEEHYATYDPLESIQQTGLQVEAKMPASQYLQEQGVSQAYVHDIVQPTVRKLFGHDLSDLNALSAVIAMDPSRTLRLDVAPNGTEGLLRRLIRLSEASIQLNTRVSSIRKSSEGKFFLKHSGNNIEKTRKTSKMISSMWSSLRLTCRKRICNFTWIRRWAYSPYCHSLRGISHTSQYLRMSSFPLSISIPIAQTT